MKIIRRGRDAYICLYLLIFALVASIMLIAYYAYVHIFAGLEIIRRGRAGLVGEARPASFSNQGSPTDYNYDYELLMMNIVALLITIK